MDTLRSCFDCKGNAPETDTDSDYSLISSGWRLSRHIAPDGSPSFEWRCPACWAKHKARTGLLSGTWALDPATRKRPSEPT